MPHHERLLRATVTLAGWVSALWISFALFVASLVLPPVPGDPPLHPTFGGVLVISVICCAVQYREWKRLAKQAGW